MQFHESCPWFGALHDIPRRISHLRSDRPIHRTGMIVGAKEVGPAAQSSCTHPTLKLGRPATCPRQSQSCNKHDPTEIVDFQGRLPSSIVAALRRAHEIPMARTPAVCAAEAACPDAAATEESWHGAAVERLP